MDHSAPPSRGYGRTDRPTFRDKPGHKPQVAITLHPVIRRRSEVSVTSALSPVSVQGRPRCQPMLEAHQGDLSGGTVAGVARSIKCEPSGAGAAHQ